ncbi:MAG TPA: glutamate-cysteine ligase family protein [Armatimonadota bacterium]|jgi:gamma-glutamyl:cysteine ligase YbdK (ATP-grasp superfamily)
MNTFHPRTFSTDWELLVIDKFNRFVGMDKLMGLAGALRAETGLLIQIDWNSLEFALGVNSSLAQFQQRARQVTDLATQFLREFDLDLFPCGSHPVEMMYNSAHFHVGTLLDETAGIYVQNRLMKYVPAFAALAANSPAASGMRDDFKSYRVRNQARGCTRPATARDPYLAQLTWGDDAGPKVYGVPTLEVRITDCASSRRLLAEMATFVAAFVQSRGEEVAEYLPDHDEYRQFLINRWSAAKYGLQATFHWNGGVRPVVDVLREMLDACTEELAELGATPADLPLLHQMLEKRTCQADFGLSLMARYSEAFALASAYGKRLRDWDAFDEYLQTAPVLDPVDAPDEAAVLAEHARLIGECTHFYRTREAMFFPPPMADKVLERLVASGLIRRDLTPRGWMLSRTAV